MSATAKKAEVVPMTTSARSVIEKIEVQPAVPSILRSYIQRPECKRLVREVLTHQEESGARTLALVSQYAGEGRSFMAAAIALSYSQFLLKRVLVIDTVQATLRTSSVLKNYLADDCYEGPRPTPPKRGVGAIEMVSPELLNDLVGGRMRAGSMEPYLLGTTMPIERESVQHLGIDFHLGNYLDNVENRYDLIIVDTCAFSEAAHNQVDPALAAAVSHMVMLVNSARSINQESISAIQKVLTQNRISLFGSVYNSGAAI